MPQFIILPSANVDGSGNITSLANAAVSQSGVVSVAGGTYRVFAVADVSLQFTPTGANTTPGSPIISGSAGVQFIIAPAANFDAAGALTSVANSYVSTNLNVTGLLSNQPYRVALLTAPSAPINTLTVPDAFLPAQWDVTDDGSGGILDFTFGPLPYDGGSPITNVNIYENGSPTPIATGLTAPGTYSRSGLTNGQPYSYTAAPVNAIGPALASDIKTRTPTAIAPPPTDFRTLVSGLKTRATPNGVQLATLKVIGVDPLPAGVTASGSTITFNSFIGDFDGWNLGARTIVFNSRVNRFSNCISSGASSGVALIQVNVGGGVTTMEFNEFRGGFGTGDAPMVLKQNSTGTGAAMNSGFIGTIRRNRFEGWSQDHLKVTGNPGQTILIEENYYGPQHAIPGTLPHTDANTVMAALGLVHIRRNFIDWVPPPAPYVAIGINNWLRIEPYRVGNLFNEVRFEENICRHDGTQSYAMQVAMKNSPIWNGPIRIQNNLMELFDGYSTAFHPTGSSFFDYWINNRDINTDALVPGPAGALTA